MPLPLLTTVMAVQVMFETFAKDRCMYQLGSSTDIGISVLVTFVIAGCPHTLYIIKHALDINNIVP